MIVVIPETAVEPSTAYLRTVLHLEFPRLRAVDDVAPDGYESSKKE